MGQGGVNGGEARKGTGGGQGATRRAPRPSALATLLSHLRVALEDEAPLSPVQSFPSDSCFNPLPPSPPIPVQSSPRNSVSQPLLSAQRELERDLADLTRTSREEGHRRASTGIVAAIRGSIASRAASSGAAVPSRAPGGISDFFRFWTAAHDTTTAGRRAEASWGSGGCVDRRGGGDASAGGVWTGGGKQAARGSARPLLGRQVSRDW